MSSGNIQCPVHGEHGNTRKAGRECGLCFAEGKTSLTPSQRVVHVPAVDEPEEEHKEHKKKER